MLSFNDGKVLLGYHFQEQLSTQISYATRPTKLRIIICDHTKLGARSGWEARIPLESLLEGTEECIIYSSWPETAKQQQSVLKQKDAFTENIKQLKGSGQVAGKRLAFRLINTKEEVHEEVTL